MRVRTGLAGALAIICLAASPALALPGKDHPGNGVVGPTGQRGPTGRAGPPAKAKAYGYYCRNESKKHVAGQKGTPFSQCVTAMAKLAKGKTNSPVAACAALSKAHTK